MAKIDDAIKYMEALRRPNGFLLAMLKEVRTEQRALERKVQEMEHRKKEIVTTIAWFIDCEEWVALHDKPSDQWQKAWDGMVTIVEEEQGG